MMPGDVSVTNEGEECFWHLLVRNTPKHPTKHRTTPFKDKAMTKNYLPEMSTVLKYISLHSWQFQACDVYAK